MFCTNLVALAQVIPHLLGQGPPLTLGLWPFEEEYPEAAPLLHAGAEWADFDGLAIRALNGDGRNPFSYRG